MTLPFQIRLATPEDANAISTVIKGLSRHFLADPEGQGADTVLQSIDPMGIAEFIAASHFCHWVASAQGQVMAVAGLRDNAHLYHLFVAPDWQGRGVGRALWQQVRSAALAAGNPGTFTVNSTLNGRAAYESFGFTVTGPVTQRDGLVYIPMGLDLLSKP
jgi:GNAT superfamily N-acetyltransferase